MGAPTPESPSHRPCCVRSGSIESWGYSKTAGHGQAIRLFRGDPVVKISRNPSHPRPSTPAMQRLRSFSPAMGAVKAGQPQLFGNRSEMITQRPSAAALAAAGSGTVRLNHATRYHPPTMTLSVAALMALGPTPGIVKKLAELSIQAGSQGPITAETRLKPGLAAV